MDFNKHYKLTGAHAFLSASSPAWLRYENDKLIERYANHKNAVQGTRLHALAAECIKMGVKLRGTEQTLAAYVNDAIGYRMIPEQILYYSDNCFGTADAISFRRNQLRIHDLKTGTITPGKMDQLRLYAAMFCLEYSFSPPDIKIELRIYQNDEVVIETPEPDDIEYCMDRIVTCDKIIQAIRDELED